MRRSACTALPLTDGAKTPVTGPSLFVAAIVGPTASGKSAIAISLAKRLGGEIVSADSMMIYRGLDIGTAKPPLRLRQEIPHHLIDIADPSEEFSAALYQPLARAAIVDISTRGMVPIVVGGTGLYVSAALDDLTFPASAATSDVRARLQRQADELGAFALHKELAEVDPSAAMSIHPNNVRRVIRALEVHELTGRKFSEMAGSFKERRYLDDTITVGINYDRDELWRRIDVRTVKMLERGWIQEAERLYYGGHEISRTAGQALGYREIRDHLMGLASLEQTVERIRLATRHYAKRQMTWFRADRRVHWIDAHAGEGAEQLTDKVELYIRTTHGKALL
jgi:tRNA dimethylallyltransferase